MMSLRAVLWLTLPWLWACGVPASTESPDGSVDSNDLIPINDASPNLRLSIVSPPPFADVPGRADLHGRCTPGADVIVDGAGVEVPAQVACPLGIFDLTIDLVAGPGPKLIVASQPSVGPEERVERTFQRPALPRAVDNSQRPWFPRIRNQGSLNSCVAFATTYYQLTYEVARQRGVDARNDTSRQFSPRWTYNLSVSGGDTGMTTGAAYTLLKHHGAATWAAFPYTTDEKSWPVDGATWGEALEARVVDTQQELEVAEPAGLVRLKERLALGEVLVASTYIEGWKYRPISDDPSTTADDPQVGKDACTHVTSGFAVYHVLTIVGYDDRLWIDLNNNGALDPGERGALRIANSYGTSWKDQGFTWFSYDALRAVSAVPGAPTTSRRQGFIGALGGTATAITVSAVPPTLRAEVRLSHERRDQLTFQVGRGDPGGAPETHTTYQLGGGAMGFTGGGEVPATLAFDLSNHAISGVSKDWFVRVSDAASGSPATVSELRVVDGEGGAWSATGLPLVFDHDSRRFEMEGALAPALSGVRLQSESSSGPVGGRAEFVLERTGDVSEPLSVELETFNLSAIAGVDFLLPFDPPRVRWAANDAAPVQLSIPLLAGAGKQFGVRLSRVHSNATAVIAIPYRATVTIQ